MDASVTSTVCLFAALACLIGLVLKRWRIGASVAFLIALLGPSLTLSPQDLGGGAISPLFLKLLVALLSFRLGYEGRRSLSTVPRPLLAIFPVILALVGLLLVGGVARMIGTDLTADPGRLSGYLLLGCLLVLPDGSGVAALSETRRSRPGVLGLHAATAFLLLPLAWLLARASFAEPAPGWTQLTRNAAPAALAALALGSFGSTLAHVLSAGATLRTVWGVQLALTLASFAAAEMIANGLGPVAALASGFAAGRPHDMDETPASEIREAAPGWGWPLFTVAAFIFAATVAVKRPITTPDLLGGLLLWGGALLARVLTTVSLVGLYRWLRPEQLSWRWIWQAAWLSFPGTLAVAVLVTSDATGSGDETLFRLLFPALCISLLVEGGTAPFLCGRRLETLSTRHLWERARGRRIALRAARRVLHLLENQGDLDELTQLEKDQLLHSLERQEKLVDLELEDLAQGSSSPTEKARAAALHEVLQSSVGALEQAARWGLISRATCDALRPEVIRWLEEKGRANGPRGDGNE